LIFLGFEIVQRWPEAVMHSWGSYFGHVPKDDAQCSRRTFYEAAKCQRALDRFTPLNS